MSGKLANTFFQTGPLDDVLAVDPYQVTTGAVKTNILDQLSGIGDDTLKTIRNQTAGVKDLARMINVKDGKYSLDTKSLTDRIMALGSGLKGPFAKISSTVQGGIIDGLAKLGVNPDTALQIRAVVGDTVSVLAKGDLTDARGIVDIIGSITGDSNIAKLLDSEAEMALFGGIINEAIRLGIPDALDILSEKISSDKTKRRVVELTLRQAVTYNDLATVRKIVGRIGPAAAKAQLPDIIMLILTFYSFPAETTPAEYDACYQDLLGVLNLIEPNWAVYTRGAQQVTDLTPFTYASDDALTLFKRDPQFQLQVLIAPSYPKQDIVSLLQGSFKYLTLTGA